MKKLSIILVALAALFFVSCEKETTGPSKKNAKTYTFIDYTEGHKYMEELAGGKYEIDYTFFINEYTESGLKVKSNVVDKPEQGKRYTFTATEDSYFLTVKWQYAIGETSAVRYMTNAFLLKEGEEVMIEVSEDTYFQKTEPK